MAPQNKKAMFLRVGRSVWFFPLLLCIALLILTIFRISGSSVGMFYSSLFGDTHDSHLLANNPRAIRSDEWEVNTPLILAQAKEGFPRINKNIGNGQDMSFVLDTPYKEWSAAFKPQHWAFFVLPVEYAFAFKWWLLGVLLMLGCYVFSLTLLPKRHALAGLISIGLFFSPFVQWWYQSATILPLAFGFFIAAVGVRLFDKTLNKKTALVWSSVFTYLLLCLAFVLYVPFLVPVGLVVSAFLFGHFLNLWGEPKHRAFLAKRLLYVAVPAVLTLAVMALFIGTRSSVVHAISSSVYPGQRIEHSGHFSFRQLVGGYFNLQLQSSSVAAHLPLNQSEASNFILIFPFLMPAVLYLSMRKTSGQRAVDWRVIALLGLLALFLIRLFMPWSDPLFHLLQFDRVPHTRLLIGIGMINVLLVLLTIKYLDDTKEKLSAVWRRRSALGAFVAIIALGFSFRSAYGSYLASRKEIVFIALAISLIVWLILKKRFAWGLALLALYSIISTIGINPLYQGLGILTHSQVSQAIGSIGDKQGAWVASNDAEFLENVTLAQGVRSLSGVYAYPQLDVWKPIGSKPADVAVYNRFAHVFFTVEDINDPNIPADAYLDPPALDAFRVHADPCSPFLKQRGVRYILAATPPVNAQCLAHIKTITYPAISLQVYEIR
ncbi:MAG TPA: hypothetical protein VMY99_00980 [Nevskiaceae bacterium]|nr:hypothetical protein [Nevskiaceae bacterium]